MARSTRITVDHGIETMRIKLWALLALMLSWCVPLRGAIYFNAWTTNPPPNQVTTNRISTNGAVTTKVLGFDGSSVAWVTPTSASTNNALYVEGSLLSGANLQTGYFRAINTNVYPALNKTFPSLVNVQDPPYNAVGDGTTDDTAAVLAAVAAAAKTPVYFPPGTYKITNSISLTSGQKLIGAGPVSRWVDNVTNATSRLLCQITNIPAIKLTATGGVNVDSVVIENLYIDGVNATGTADGVNLESANTSQSVKHFMMRGSHVRDFPRFQLRSATNNFDIRFVGTTFMNPGRSATGDDLVFFIDPSNSQFTFDDCWWSQYRAGKWSINGPCSDIRVFSGTVAPMDTTATGANGFTIQNGAIHLVGTHFEGPNTTGTNNTGIFYVGRSGGLVAPSAMVHFGVGIKIGDGSVSGAEYLTIAPSVINSNLRDIWITAGGSRLQTMILNTGHLFSGGNPVVVDDRLSIDGIPDVIRGDFRYKLHMTTNGNAVLGGADGNPTTSGLLRLGNATGTTYSSANNPMFNLGNNGIISWFDSTGAKTNAVYLWGDASNNLQIGAGNITRMTLTPYGFLGLAGDTTPDYPVDIAGDVRIQGGQFLHFGGSTTNSADVSFFLAAADRLSLTNGDLQIANLSVSRAVITDANKVLTSATGTANSTTVLLGDGTYSQVGSAQISDVPWSIVTAGENANTHTNSGTKIAKTSSAKQDLTTYNGNNVSQNVDFNSTPELWTVLTNNTTFTLVNVPSGMQSNRTQRVTLNIYNPSTFTGTFVLGSTNFWLSKITPTITTNGWFKAWFDWTGTNVVGQYDGGATNELAVLYGGTGTNTLNSGEVLIGAGTGSVTTKPISGTGGIVATSGSTQTNSTLSGATVTTNTTFTTETLSPSGGTNFVCDFLSSSVALITATNDVFFLNTTNRVASTANARFKAISILASGANRRIDLQATGLLLGDTSRTITVTNGTWLEIAVKNRGSNETNCVWYARYAQ